MMQGSHLGFQASGLGSKVISGLGPGLAPRMGSGTQAYPKQGSGLAGGSGHRLGFGSGRGLGSGRQMMSNLGGGMQVQSRFPTRNRPRYSKSRDQISQFDDVQDAMDRKQ